MATERHHLDIVKLKHESSEEGASRCTISITDWNSGLGECRKNRYGKLLLMTNLLGRDMRNSEGVNI